MKTNVSGLNDAKFQVNTLLQSMLCIFTFAEMEVTITNMAEPSYNKKIQGGDKYHTMSLSSKTR